MPATLLTIVTLALFAPPQQGPKEAPTEVTLTGKVVMLESVFKGQGIEADPEATRGQVVLVAADGSVVPLVSGPASRALFLDERLRNRPTEIKGWRRKRLPYVEVVLFRVEEEGKLRVPEYWCDVCSISVRAPQICPCCQGSMELRYKAER